MKPCGGIWMKGDGNGGGEEKGRGFMGEPEILGPFPIFLDPPHKGTVHDQINYHFQ